MFLHEVLDICIKMCYTIGIDVMILSFLSRKDMSRHSLRNV
jgi:hypothetical protein